MGKAAKLPCALSSESALRDRVEFKEYQASCSHGYPPSLELISEQPSSSRWSPQMVYATDVRKVHAQAKSNLGQLAHHRRIGQRSYAWKRVLEAIQLPFLSTCECVARNKPKRHAKRTQQRQACGSRDHNAGSCEKDARHNIVHVHASACESQPHTCDAFGTC